VLITLPRSPIFLDQPAPAWMSWLALLLTAIRRNQDTRRRDDR
jgi:hypothetical protein